MKIHSDVLRANDFHGAISRIGGAYIDNLTEHGSRSRKRAYRVNLSGSSGRKVNSGQWGAGYQYAATRDQWGRFLAYLYKLDPHMIATDTGYADADDFHKQTEGKYA